MELYGRTQIFTAVKNIDITNIKEIVRKASATHQKNVTQINYLYDYYRGKQEVLNRDKVVNDYVLYNIAENRAKEIVDFKTAYSFGDLVVYSATDGVVEGVDVLNDFMRLEGKGVTDLTLGEWLHICGVGYKAVFPKGYADTVPFTVDTIDPRECYVIYSNGIRKEPVACVYEIRNENDEKVVSAYAKTEGGIKFFTWTDEEAPTEEEWTLSYLPIVEYKLNSARLGAFEPVIPLLDAINNLTSARAESIEQFVESLLILINCELPEGFTASTLKQKGVIELPSDPQNKAEIKQLCSQLDQTATQSLKDDMYDAVLTICSMPNRNTNDSGSNGITVIYRDGWTAASTASKLTQRYFEPSEYDTLRLVLQICEETNALSLDLARVKIDFTGDHYENLATKVSSLVTMLNCDWIDNHTAFRAVGMFSDPDAECENGIAWHEEYTAAEEEPTETEETEIGTVEI